MRKLHITNAGGRDATVRSSSVKPAAAPPMGLPGQVVRFARFLSSAESGLHSALVAAQGEDYGQALLDGDPEVDLESIGRFFRGTDQVSLSSEGEVLYAAPEVIEVVYAPDGSEKERRAPVVVAANVNETDPVVWTGKTLPKGKVVQRFAFQRTLQIRHVDGLTYDYLFAMAKELADAGEMVLIGGGAGGKKPLVFQMNGSPYRGFLEGRVDGARYKLLLHLSNMELKRPAEKV